MSDREDADLSRYDAPGEAETGQGGAKALGCGCCAVIAVVGGVMALIVALFVRACMMKMGQH